MDGAGPWRRSKPSDAPLPTAACNAGTGIVVRAPPPPPVVVHAVLNPLSKAAQRLAPLLGFLRDLLDAEALLLLNPKARTGSASPSLFRRCWCGG